MKTSMTQLLENVLKINNDRYLQIQKNKQLNEILEQKQKDIKYMDY